MEPADHGPEYFPLLYTMFCYVTAITLHFTSQNHYLAEWLRCCWPSSNECFTVLRPRILSLLINLRKSFILHHEIKVSGLPEDRLGGLGDPWSRPLLTTVSRF